jgi:RNA polymerase sigma-70 factor (ECF subfamily)
VHVPERTDPELLLGESPSDFGAFYDRHVGIVSAFVARRINQPEVIFDLVAETFARALERRDQYDAARGPASAWLLGITRNLMIDSGRRGQVEAAARRRLGLPRIELDDDQLTLITERSNLDLEAALSHLAPEQREAILRRVVLDESYGEIATALRCSEQVARKRVSRGLAALRSRLEGGL